jgi:hypothetical protein
LSKDHPEPVEGSFHQPDLKIALTTLGAAVRPAIFIPTGGEIAMTNC